MRQLPSSGFCGSSAIPATGCSGSSGVGTSCVAEAPQDGTPYARQDAGWVASVGGVEEAPEDGTPYARQDAGWVVLAGGGDMLKATYDADNDGVVDAAETVAWAGVSGAPSFITSTGVTYANLNANGDVGTGAAQVAAGNHTHAGVYEPAGVSSNDITDSSVDGRAILTSADANPFTDAEKTKLSGIAAGAEVNVNADWNAVAGDAQILNKPTTMTPTAHGNEAHSSTFITTAGVTYDNLNANADVGTGADQVAVGNHSHAQLHDRSHAMTGASDHTAGNWKVFYSNGSGAVTELALGADGEYLKSNGASSAPSFATPTGAAHDAVTVGATLTDVISLSTQALGAVDAAANKIVYWNDTSNKLTYGTVSDVGAAASSHTHAATDINSGTLGTDYFSAYSDLTAESKIGTGADQVAAGNHTHAQLHDAVTLGSTVTDVFNLSTQAIGGVDAAADKIVYWNNTSNKITYGTVSEVGAAAASHSHSEYVEKATYDAHSILYATTDNTPAALTVTEQTVVGRITGGNITALSASQIRTLINVEDGADVTDATNVDAAGAVMNADFDANTILAATTDNTPAAITIAENDIVGRLPSGAIGGVTLADLTEETAPAAGDFALGWESGGAIRKFNLAKVPTLLFGFALGDETTAHTATERVATDIPGNCIITRVYVSVKTAPTGSALTVDVEDEGNSILNAVVSVADGANNGETSTFAAAATSYEFTKGDLMTIDIDAVGSTTAGAGGKVYFYGYWTA